MHLIFLQNKKKTGKIAPDPLIRNTVFSADFASNFAVRAGNSYSKLTESEIAVTPWRCVVMWCSMMPRSRILTLVLPKHIISSRFRYTQPIFIKHTSKSRNLRCGYDVHVHFTDRHLNFSQIKKSQKNRSRSCDFSLRTASV